MDLAVQERLRNEKTLDLIMYFASGEGIQALPGGEAELILTLAVAVVEYLNGDITKIPSLPYIATDNRWSYKFNAEVELVFQSNSKNIDPELVIALRDILHVEWQRDYGESWWESPIRWYLVFGRQNYGSTFYLTHAKVKEIEENLRGNIAANTVGHLKQIGGLMRKNILAAEAVN